MTVLAFDHDGEMVFTNAWTVTTFRRDRLFVTYAISSALGVNWHSREVPMTAEEFATLLRDSRSPLVQIP